MTLPPPDGLVTALQAEELLDVPAATIRKWKQRGDVVQADSIPGRGRTGAVPLFRLDELQPLARSYHSRRATPAPSIDPCPVCHEEVLRLVATEGNPSAIAMPCTHAVTRTVGKKRITLARWTPRTP